jgi:hypothetical protein
MNAHAARPAVQAPNAAFDGTLMWVPRMQQERVRTESTADGVPQLLIAAAAPPLPGKDKP